MDMYIVGRLEVIIVLWLYASVDYLSAVVIGFSQVDYTIDGSAGTVSLSVSVQNGSIPESESRIVTLATSDGTAQCMLALIHFPVS